MKTEHLRRRRQAIAGVPSPRCRRDNETERDDGGAWQLFFSMSTTSSERKVYSTTVVQATDFERVCGDPLQYEDLSGFTKELSATSKQCARSPIDIR